jgi:methionyl-tRNA formyltransferase
MAPHVVETYAARLESLGHELVGVAAMRQARRPEALEAIERAAPTAVVVEARDELAPALVRFAPDVAICSGWGWRIGPDALAVPRFGIVNGHPSKLPRWRGPNPFGWTLRANDPELGFTFHYMDTDFDTGAILAQGSLPLDGDETARDLLPLMRELSVSLLQPALERVEAGDPGDPQPEESATYAGLYEDEFAEIDWRQPARAVFDQVRCWFVPTKSGILGPLTTLDGERVRVLEASLEPGDGVAVECGDGRPLYVRRTEPV